MSWNPNFFLSLIIGIFLFIVSIKLFQSLRSNLGKWLYFITCLVLALISACIPAAYISDLIGANPFYAQFRTIPYIELLVALVAPLIALIATVLRHRSTKRSIYGLFLLATLLYISVPFIKPVLRPLQNNIGNKWLNGVVLQTTSSTCGPSSLATVLSYYGIKDTEANIAKQVFTSSSGTENWYLARYVKRLNFNYQFFHQPDLSKVPTPSIIGVKLSRAGHFISLLEYKNGSYTIADSLSGLHHLTLEEFNKKYTYDGFVLHIYPK